MDGYTYFLQNLTGQNAGFSGGSVGAVPGYIHLVTAQNGGDLGFGQASLPSADATPLHGAGPGSQMFIEPVPSPIPVEATPPVAQPAAGPQLILGFPARTAYIGIGVGVALLFLLMTDKPARGGSYDAA